MAKIKTRTKQGFTYILRESVETESGYLPKDIYDLGPCPGAWIDYPGGNAWYLSPDLESQIAEVSTSYTPSALEDLFWPFLRPGIQAATQAFKERASGFNRTSRAEKEALARATHAFDKRRAHFLKFGNMDQGNLVNMPAVLFKPFQKKSRDEIEQWFMDQEREIRPRELKSYVYTIFDLQSHFQGILAKQMPHALDQNKVESRFLKEICRVNKDLFSLTSHLHDYMIRYLIMFFDYTYDNTRLLDDMERDFRFRHRSFKPRPKSSISNLRARELFGINKSDLNTLDKKNLTKKFRKLAREHHPDMGGDHEKFVEINDAYQALLEKIQVRPSA